MIGRIGGMTMVQLASDFGQQGVKAAQRSGSLDHVITFRKNLIAWL